MTDDNNKKRCSICGADNLVFFNYLNYKSDSISRNFAYLIPDYLAKGLSVVSKRFAKRYLPVSVNKKYFDRTISYCPNCQTGSVQPPFAENELSNYYTEFYWRNRGQNESKYVSMENEKVDGNLALSRERIDWIFGRGATFLSVIDFGAGDCAGAFVFKNERRIDAVHVVDASDSSRIIADKYNLPFYRSVSDAPLVDLIYSAHSIEHVHDLISVIQAMLGRLKVGGYLFLETPNIGDQEVLSAMVHTPHTYMLSENSFRQLETRFPVCVKAIECCGPAWKKHYTTMRSDAKADLRVLLQKLS